MQTKSTPMSNATETIEIHVHGIDGSIKKFTQRDGSLLRQTLDWFQPNHVFTQQRIEIPGEHSLTTFIASQVTRIDLVTEPHSLWNRAPGLVEAVELSEPAFRALAQGQQLHVVEKPSPPPDNTAMVLFDVALAGGKHVFLALETAVSQTPQNMESFSTLLTSTSFSFLTRTGGVAVLNVANLMWFTVYPDPAQVSMDARAAVLQRNATEPGSPQRQYGPLEIDEQEAA